MLMQSSSGATSHHPPAPAKIGPNSLIQTVNALMALYAYEDGVCILETGHYAYLLDESPAHMVAESEFDGLVALLADQLGVDAAHNVLTLSGKYTADYLLANRIPGPFQSLLKRLPDAVAYWMLLAAIRNHAWTFAGSGEFGYTLRPTPLLSITTPIAPGAAVGGYYSGTFGHLFRELVNPNANLSTVAIPQDDGRTLWRCAVEAG